MAMAREGTPTLTRRRLNRATLARQMLLAREPVPVAAAVERLAGLQAQEARPPFVGLWARVERFRREDLHAALHARSVVRALLMRGTLHVMSARDYAAVRMALQPMLEKAVRMLGDRARGLDAGAVVDAARALLADGPLTFAAIRERLVEAFPGANDRALGYLVRTHLPMVMVPTADRWSFPAAAAFARADTWLPEPVAPDASPEALVRRHLAAFGPATAADVAEWCGLTGMGPVLARMRGELRTFRDERCRELFDVVGAPLPDADVPAPPRLLPEFDSLVLAHADRSRLLADEHRPRVVTKNLRVRATFLVDGVVAGTWTATRTRARATLRLSPFAPVPAPALDELAAEAESLLRFTDEDASSFAVEVT